jgi:hypothetical protein
VNWTQWRARADLGEVKRVTWVCGDQAVLVEEVVGFIRTQLAVSELDDIRLTAGESADTALWAAANQLPLTPGASRLVTVRDAEKISNWEPLPGWLRAGRTLTGVHLLFVSGEADFPHTTVGRKTTLAGHIETMKPPRGHLVRCSLPNGTDAVAWVRRHAQVDDATAKYMLIRSGGSLAKTAAVCAKLALFRRTPDRAVIDQLLDQAPADSFVDSLLALDKKAALSAIPGLRGNDFGKAIGVLDQRLDQLAVLYTAVQTARTARDIPGVPTFLARQLLPVAKFYDPKRCTKCRQALAVVDEAHRSGARVGVAEALVAMW